MLKLILLECRLLLRERIAMLLFAVLVAACALAFVNGRNLLAEQVEGRAISAVEDKEADDAFRKRFAKPPPPELAILGPYRVKMGIMAPLPPLVDLSAGRAVFENYSTQITLRSRIDTLFKRTNTENPELLARGSFDLGFVAIVIAPLLLIGLGYGLFAADRDSGTARLLLAQAGTPLRVMAARSLPRLLLVALPILITALSLLMVGTEIEGRGAALTQWLTIAALLLLFWMAVILAVNSFKLTAESAALALVSLWAVFTLVLPAAIAAVAQNAYPPPSRFVQIAAARAAEVASTEAYENDHPDLVSEDVAGRLASIRKTFGISQKVEAAITPVNAGFDAQLGKQQELVRALGWLSPSIVAAEALNDTAGTGTRSWLGFRNAIATYLTAFRQSAGGYVVRGELIDEAGYASLPRFVWKGSPANPTPQLVYLLILSALIGAVAVTRFRRIRLN